MTIVSAISHQTLQEESLRRHNWRIRARYAFGFGIYTHHKKPRSYLHDMGFDFTLQKRLKLRLRHQT